MTSTVTDQGSVLQISANETVKPDSRSAFPIHGPLPASHRGVIPGVAVWGQCGGPPLLQDRPHRARSQALHGPPDVPRASQRAAGGRGLDGRVQEPRLHGLERSSAGGEERS